MQPTQSTFMDRGRIQDLVVVHRLKDAAAGGWPDKIIDTLRQTAFFLDTCLRQLAVFAGPDDTLGNTDLRHAGGQEFFSGSDAYQFLLQTATGLNSAIPAETNVFGQFKRAWSTCRENSDPAVSSRLAAPMQQLFADTRRIRAAFLQGVGGASYGSLVRKVLRPAADERVLFIGAGDLARSMLPFFRFTEVAIWNRSEPREDIATWVHRYTPQQIEAAARWADMAILTTPADFANDRLWASLLSRHGVERVAHLGLRSTNLGPWANFDRLFNLDDVFRLRRVQSTVRSLQVQRARQACREIVARRAARQIEPDAAAMQLERAYG